MSCPHSRAHTLALISSLALLLLCAVSSFADTVSWDANAQGQFITALCLGPNNAVWIGTEDQGVWQYNPAAPAGKQYSHYTQQDGLGDDNAYALAVDKAGRLWAGTLNHGVSVFNGKTWRTYGPLDGPLGSRVFALAVNPKDGGVWGATEAGLFRYQNSHWTYFTRADGLPSDQANALAFDADGTLYVGTQCDGIAIASPANGYKSWRTVSGPKTLPNAPLGAGLPSALINCLLVTKTGTVYAGTNCGLAASTDEGRTWQYRRGLDWKAKEAGLFPPVTPASVTVSGNLLSEDYVTALAERADGSIFVGHRQKGVEAFDSKTGLRVQSGANGATTTDYISALLLTEQSVWLGRYGGGLLTPPAASETAAVPNSSAAILPLPVPAAPPALAELNAMLTRVKALKGELPVGSGAYLGEDWQTQGDAIGRYGRQYARFFAMQSPWGDHFPTSAPGYLAMAKLGPRYADHDALRFWVQWVKTDNPNSLYDPELGCRRQAEADDHGEAFDRMEEGPDIWIRVSVPSGMHRVSLYFFNKDGHFADDRHRDYLVSLLPYRSQMADAQVLAPLAQTRVRAFWNGVYKSFLVRGPSLYYVKIARNHSFNTLCSAVFIDSEETTNSPQQDMKTIWLGKQSYNAPDPTVQDTTSSLTTKSPLLQNSRELWGALMTERNRNNNFFLQQSYRVFAYRSALYAGGYDASQTLDYLLSNWRWEIHLWTKGDRQEFNDTMATAHKSLLELHPHFVNATF